jgi:hypothetical protein
MNRWNNQEIDNAKKGAWRFGQDCRDGVGDIARRCDDHDHFGAIDGESGHREEGRETLRGMPYGPAGVE